mmetsp:Transcript_10829/g.24551  ORF Transcript_10829/g.24551 Transcript_10829/m.24551 type:complete len:273 (+) Transcript_10829:320-1138(+)
MVCLGVHRGQTRPGPINHRAENVAVSDALEQRWNLHKLFDFPVVGGADVFEGRVELQTALLEHKLHLDTRKRLVAALETEPVLHLQGLVELVVPVRAPGFGFVEALGLHQLNMLAKSTQAFTPLVTLSDKIRVHQLDGHVRQLAVSLAKPSVLGSERLRRSLQALDVALKLLRVVPGYGPAARLDLLVLDNLLKGDGVLEQHRLLARNDLGADGVVEVGHLFEHNTVAVELVRGVNCLLELAGDAEPEGSDLPNFTQELHQTLAVMHLEQAI